MHIELISEFRDACGLIYASACTVRLYCWAARTFAGAYIDLDETLLTPEHVQAFIEAQSRVLKPRSLRTLMGGVQVFLYWLQARGFLSAEFTADTIEATIPYIKTPSLRGRAIDPAAYLAAVRHILYPQRAVLELLLLTKIPLQELCKARVEDLERIGEDTILRYTKCGVEQSENLRDKAVAALRGYADVAPPVGPWLFPGRGGNAPISATTVRVASAVVRKALGLKKLNVARLRRKRIILAVTQAEVVVAGDERADADDERSQENETHG